MATFDVEASPSKSGRKVNTDRVVIESRVDPLEVALCAKGVEQAVEQVVQADKEILKAELVLAKADARLTKIQTHKGAKGAKGDPQRSVRGVREGPRRVLDPDRAHDTRDSTRSA